jgi:spore maturation protein CgeB
VRLFEAAACGTPIISDVWDGIDDIFVPDREIRLAQDPDAVLEVLLNWPPDRTRRLADAARHRVLSAHTAAHRAEELEGFISAAIARGTAWQRAALAAEG